MGGGMDGRVAILIVEDQPLVRMGIHAVVECVDGLEVVAEASSGPEAVALTREYQPDVVMLDVTLSDTCGLHLVDSLREASQQTRFVILTESSDLRIIRDAASFRIRSFCAKNSTPAEMVAAVHAAVDDRWYVDASGIADLVDLLCRVPGETLQRPDSRYDALSQREREVFAMLLRGMTNKEIGVSLGISHKTAETHHLRVLRKLGVCDSVGLLRYAARLGVIDVRSWADS